jgi:acetoacetyl-CoA synthetase
MTEGTINDLLWAPPDPSTLQSTLFRKHVNSRYSLSLESYEDLWRWSCDQRGSFWSGVWEWENIIGQRGRLPVVDETATPSDNPPWFPDTTLNWAENQLRHGLTHPHDIAIIQTSEGCSGWTPPTLKITQSELRNKVGQVQRFLKQAGVEKGDRIAFWGGNCAEAVIVLLATSSLGGIFSSAAADFGLDGVKERLDQVCRLLLDCASLLMLTDPTESSVRDEWGCIRFPSSTSDTTPFAVTCYSVHSS